MNDATLAAVIAAAMRLFAREQTAVLRPPGTCWNLAGRLPAGDPANAQLVARARSRWAMSERLRE